MKKIILASTSPRRKEILSKMRIDFEVEASDYEEDMTLDMKPKDLAAFLSKGKAEAVAKNHQNAIVIGADTIVVLDNKILGKPSSPEDAKRMLRELSGRINSVITGFTIIDTETQTVISDADESFVTIKELTEEEIDNYVKSGEPLDKAGAYAIQELGGVLIEKIEGDFFSIMGFPLFRIAEKLKQFGIKAL